MLVEKQEEHYIGEQVERIEEAGAVGLHTAELGHAEVEKLLVAWVFRTYHKTSFPHQLTHRNDHKNWALC